MPSIDEILNGYKITTASISSKFRPVASVTNSANFISTSLIERFFSPTLESATSTAIYNLSSSKSVKFYGQDMIQENKLVESSLTIFAVLLALFFLNMQTSKQMTTSQIKLKASANPWCVGFVFIISTL